MSLALGRFSIAVADFAQCAGTRLLGACSNFHSLSIANWMQPKPGGLFNVAVRYNIRNHFPRPSERKRIQRHGWVKRMSTPGGQRIIMRRILKGKHVLTH